MFLKIATVFLSMDDEVFLLAFGKELQETLIFRIILSDFKVHEVRTC